MTNPVLVEVSRGGEPESRHRGAVAVFDAEGKVVLSIGDIDAPVYPRSAIKAMQALPLVESGAADKYGFGNRELALAFAQRHGLKVGVCRQSFCGFRHKLFPTPQPARTDSL